jgi:hypothetical protein
MLSCPGNCVGGLEEAGTPAWAVTTAQKIASAKIPVNERHEAKGLTSLGCEGYGATAF